MRRHGRGRDHHHPDRNHDPDGDHDWRITAEVDLAASDAAGSAIVRATAFDRLDA